MQDSSSARPARNTGDTLPVRLGIRRGSGTARAACAFGTFAVLLACGSFTRPCAASDPDVPPPQAPGSDESSPESSEAQEIRLAPSTPPPADVSAFGTAPKEDALVATLPPPPDGSGGIAVFPVVATNLTEGESAALGVLFASELSENKGGRLIAPATASRYSIDSYDRKSAASYMDVEQYLLVEAVRLDQTTIVTATLHNQDGSTVRKEKMAAKSVDDFQHVTERLVLALLSGTSVEKTRTLDNVTKGEADGSNRTFVEKIFGFKTSLIMPYSSQIDLPMMVGTSFNGRLEGDSYFLEFGGGFLLPTSANNGADQGGYGGMFADIGWSYYLTHTNVSSYVGAGVMPRVLSTQPANLAAYGQAGLMFFRTSSSRLYTELRVAQNVTPMEILEYSYDYEADVDHVTTTRFWPIEFGVNVGLGW